MQTTLNHTFSLSIPALRAASKLASKDKNRDLLTGVYYLERENLSHYVATDGRALVILSTVNPHTDGTTRGIYIPAGCLPKKGDICTVVAKESSSHKMTVSVSYKGGSLSAESENQRFPNFAQVLPRETFDPRKPAYGFDPVYFGLLGDCVAEMTDRRPLLPFEFSERIVLCSYRVEGFDLSFILKGGQATFDIFDTTKARETVRKNLLPFFA